MAHGTLGVYTRFILRFILERHHYLRFLLTNCAHLTVHTNYNDKPDCVLALQYSGDSGVMHGQVKEVQETVTSLMEDINQLKQDNLQLQREQNELHLQHAEHKMTDQMVREQHNKTAALGCLTEKLMKVLTQFTSRFILKVFCEAYAHEMLGESVCL